MTNLLLVVLVALVVSCGGVEHTGEVTIHHRIEFGDLRLVCVRELGSDATEEDIAWCLDRKLKTLFGGSK